MKILALDLSTTTGWACGEPGANPTHGTLRLPKTDKDIGAYAVAFTNLLGPLLDEHEPDRVCFESPIKPVVTSIYALRKTTGLAYHTEFICKIRGIPCSETPMQTARSTLGCTWPKRGLTRKQRRDHWKAEVMRLCRAMGWEPRDDNEADALCVWYDACEKFRPRALRLAFS